MKIHCFFCGEILQNRQPDERWLCGKCRASFHARLDPEGCVSRLEVEQCGTPDCCRKLPSPTRPA